MRNWKTVLPLAAIAAAAGFLPIGRARAEDGGPGAAGETVVVTATRLPTPADEVAAGVDVIDAATMAQRGYTTLDDALSAVAGAHLVASGGPGANASLFVRGADSDQVQVLVDGVAVNDASGPGGAYNFGVETLAGVARIEIVRGPMSAVYGSGAIGGVVNIITTRGSNAAQFGATLAGGAPGQLLSEADLRGTRGAFDYSLSLEGFSDRGFDVTPRREIGVYSGERDGDRSRLADATVGYTPVEGTRVFAALRGRSSVFGYDEVNFPAFDAPDTTGRDNDFLLRGGVDSRLAGGAWQTGLAAAFSQQYRRYVERLDAADPNQASEDSRYVGQRIDVQWNNTILLPDTDFSRSTALTGGYAHDSDTAHERLNSASGGFPYLASVNATDQRDSVYLGLQGEVARRLTLSANLREEAVSGVGDAFTWRAGGSLALPEIAAHLKASYGTAFLAPSLFDRYGVDSFGYVGNPALKPERSAGYEIGLVRDLGRHASISATWFDSRVHDLIETVFAPAYTSVNVAAARLQGVETALHVHGWRWIGVDATYTYTDARNSRTGQLLLRRPYDTGSLSVVVMPSAALSLAPQLVFAGGARDALVDDHGFPAGDGLNPGGATVNFNLSYQAAPRLRLFLWAKNIFDARYEAASGFAPPGASFLAGIRYGE